MRVPKVVLDTNVLVSALCSNRGASYRMVRGSSFSLAVSVPLVIEYEAVLKREKESLGLTVTDVDDILDFICSVADRRAVFYLWRPFLRDPQDDLVLELAVEAECDHIVTYNRKDFTGVEQFGLSVITPREFLRQLGEIK